MNLGSETISGLGFLLLWHSDNPHGSGAELFGFAGMSVAETGLHSPIPHMSATAFQVLLIAMQEVPSLFISLS